MPTAILLRLCVAKERTVTGVILSIIDPTNQQQPCKQLLYVHRALAEPQHAFL